MTYFVALIIIWVEWFMKIVRYIIKNLIIRAQTHTLTWLLNTEWQYSKSCWTSGVKNMFFFWTRKLRWKYFQINFMSNISSNEGNALCLFCTHQKWLTSETLIIQSLMFTLLLSAVLGRNFLSILRMFNEKNMTFLSYRTRDSSECDTKLYKQSLYFLFHRIFGPVIFEDIHYFN